MAAAALMDGDDRVAVDRRDRREKRRLPDRHVHVMDERPARWWITIVKLAMLAGHERARQMRLRHQ